MDKQDPINNAQDPAPRVSLTVMKVLATPWMMKDTMTL